MRYFKFHVKTYVLLILLFVTNTNSAVRVLSQLNQFDKAPELVLPLLVSPAESMDIQKLDRPAILIFGEPYNQKTLDSLVKLKEIVDTIGLTETDLRVFLIISHTPDEQRIAQINGKENIGLEILLDKNLKAFGEYGITVLPSIVVIDKEDRIDLALSGVPLTFSDMVEDAILLAMGRITQQQLESSGNAIQQNNAQQESVKQAHRLTILAGQLANRGFTSLAVERYREALTLDDSYQEARIGMARCLLKLNLIPSAVTELNTVLQADPNNIEANLIISQIEIIQGGDNITESQQRLQQILTMNPDQPEANYLMGMVYETQGEIERALSYYKKAAKRLLETSVY